jgi:hypothetical protein
MLFLTNLYLVVIELFFVAILGRDIYYSRTEKPVEVKRVGIILVYLIILLTINILIYKLV